MHGGQLPIQSEKKSQCKLKYLRKLWSKHRAQSSIKMMPNTAQIQWCSLPRMVCTMWCPRWIDCGQWMWPMPNGEPIYFWICKNRNAISIATIKFVEFEKWTNILVIFGFKINFNAKYETLNVHAQGQIDHNYYYIDVKEIPSALFIRGSTIWLIQPEHEKIWIFSLAFTISLWRKRTNMLEEKNSVTSVDAAKIYAHWCDMRSQHHRIYWFSRTKNICLGRLRIIRFYVHVHRWQCNNGWTYLRSRYWYTDVMPKLR